MKYPSVPWYFLGGILPPSKVISSAVVTKALSPLMVGFSVLIMSVQEAFFTIWPFSSIPNIDHSPVNVPVKSLISFGHGFAVVCWAYVWLCKASAKSRAVTQRNVVNTLFFL